MWWTKPKLSQKQRILNALNKGSLTSRDMVNMNIFRYSARINDLRNEGYNIRCIRLKGSLFYYYLIRPAKQQKYELKYERVK